MAVTVLMVAGIQAVAQTPPPPCTCASAIAKTCAANQDCINEVTVTEDGSGNCQASFGYCLLCVISDGASAREVKWNLKSSLDPKFVFLTPDGIKIPTPGRPAEFVDLSDSNNRRTYSWKATKNFSAMARSHSAQVSNGSQTCEATPSNIVNTK